MGHRAQLEPAVRSEQVPTPDQMSNRTSDVLRGPRGNPVPTVVPLCSNIDTLLLCTRLAPLLET